MNYIGKHWRGELSLGMAFGVNMFLVGIALIFVVAFIAPFILADLNLVFVYFYLIFRYLIIFP